MVSGRAEVALMEIGSASRLEWRLLGHSRWDGETLGSGSIQGFQKMNTNVCPYDLDACSVEVHRTKAE